MNYESSQWRRDALEDVPVDQVVIDARRRSRRRLIIAALLVVVAAVAAVFLLGGSGQKAAAPVGSEGQTLPAVTVIVPGRTDVPLIINATGSLAARRDMPVGVPGQGGAVVRVLVDAGTWVSAGQTLAVIDRSVQVQQAAQLAAQVQVAQANLQLAQSQLDRAQSLVARGFVSREEIDTKRATRDGAAAQLRVAQAQLAQTRAQIGQLDVRAPDSGLILSRSVEAGQVVGPGTGALFHIARAGEIEMLARLPQDDLARIHVGVPATVTPVGSSESFQGAVWQNSPTIDPLTRQGFARILIPYNPDLRPGGFASAQIHAGATTAPLLPESAVLSDEHGNYVYVIDAHNLVVRRDVRLGDVTDRGIPIASGLGGDERVVLSAGAFLNPGQRVRPELQAAAHQG